MPVNYSWGNLTSARHVINLKPNPSCAIWNQVEAKSLVGNLISTPARLCNKFGGDRVVGNLASSLAQVEVCDKGHGFM